MKKISLVALLCVCVLVLAACSGSSDANSGNKVNMAAQTIIDAAHNFKSPQSVRLISGTCLMIEEKPGEKPRGIFYARLSAENSYGAKNAQDYCVYYSKGTAYIATEADYADGFKDSSKFEKTNDVDVGAVNRIIADYWKGKGF